MIASRGEVKMILCEGESARILERVNNSYLVKLPIEGKEYAFTIFPRSDQPVSIYRVYPEFIALKTNSTRIEVAWKLGGKAIYRPAWKDSDEAKGIVGFIDPLDFPDLATEEAIVWLTGTLAVVGLPYMQAD